MDKNIIKARSLDRKKNRIRKKIEGDSSRPRLTVFRSERHIYGQIIDDIAGTTLVSASSVAKDLRDNLKDLDPKAVATKVGEALAEKAKAAGIEKVVFDRNGRAYSGRVACLADGARSKGLLF